MRNYSDAGQDRVCVHGAATSSRRSTSLSRAWLRDVCKPREYGHIAVGLANKDRYPSKHASVSHPHTCAGLTEAQLALRKDQRSRSLLAEGPEGGGKKRGLCGSLGLGWPQGNQAGPGSATQRGRRCQGPSRTRTSTRLRCLRRWRKRIPTMTTCEHPAVAKAGFMRAGAWRPWATTSCCG